VAQISVTVSMPVGVAAVWQALRDFAGVIRWVPGIDSVKVKGAGVGAVRTVTFKDGGRAVERLESLSDDARTLSYTILDSTYPLEGYVASLTVKDLGPKGCEVEWFSTFGPKGAAEGEVTALLEKTYRVSLANLARLLRRAAAKGGA